MSQDRELDFAISLAQKSYKEKLDALGEVIRNSAADFENDPLLITLKQDAATEAFVPLRLRELYEDRTTKELIEGLKKELNKAITECFLEQNARSRAEKQLELEKIGKKESQEQIGILKLSIKELESNLENLRVKYETGMKSKQSEIQDRRTETQKHKLVLEDLEKLNSSRTEEILSLKSQLDKSQSDQIRLEELISAIRNENEILVQKVHILEDELYDINIKYKDASKEVEFLNSQVFKITEEKQELEESTSFFKSTLVNEKDKELQDFKEQVKDVRKKLSTKLQTVKDEVERKNIEIYELKGLLEKYEQEFDTQKGQYAKIIASQAEEISFINMTTGQREKEKDDQYVNMLKNMNENYIEKKIHNMLLAEQNEQLKNSYMKNLKNMENELNYKWEKEIREVIMEKDDKIEQLKKRINEVEEEKEDEMNKAMYAEKMVEIEKARCDEIVEKNEALQESLNDLQQIKDTFVLQIDEVNNVVNELKTQISDLQAKKMESENKNAEYENEIKSIEKRHNDTHNNNLRKHSDAMNENKLLQEKIEELENQIQLVNNELNKKIEYNKFLERKNQEFKNSANESIEKLYIELQQEKEKNRNAMQRVLEDLELEKINNEILDKKHQKCLQEISYLNGQISYFKEEIEVEAEKGGTLKNSMNEYLEHISQLELIIEEKKADMIRYKKEIRIMLHEIFSKVHSEFNEIKLIFIDEIQCLNKDTCGKTNDLMNLIARSFNKAKLNWLNDLEDLNSNLVSCKMELKRCKDLLNDTEENRIKDQNQFKNIIETLEQALELKDAELKGAIGRLQSLEKNQKDLQDLLEMKETEIFKLKEQYEQSYNDHEILYNDYKDLDQFYKGKLKELLENIIVLEESQQKQMKDLYTDVSDLKNVIRDDLLIMEEGIGYKDFRN